MRAGEFLMRWWCGNSMSENQLGILYGYGYNVHHDVILRVAPNWRIVCLPIYAKPCIQITAHRPDGNL